MKRREFIIAFPSLIYELVRRQLSVIVTLESTLADRAKTGFSGLPKASHLQRTVQ